MDGPQQPGQPDAPPARTRPTSVYYPPADHPAWIAFNDGTWPGSPSAWAEPSQEYDYAEIFSTETPPAPSHASVMFAADGRSRHEVTRRRAAERRPARTEYTGPSLSGPRGAA